MSRRCIPIHRSVNAHSWKKRSRSVGHAGSVLPKGSYHGQCTHGHPGDTRGACRHSAVTLCTWSKPIPRPRVCRHVTWRKMPQPWLPRVETEPSMAEQGIEADNPRKKLPTRGGKGVPRTEMQAPKHHPAILTSQMQSQHPLQRSRGHYPTQCGI